MLDNIHTFFDNLYGTRRADVLLHETLDDGRIQWGDRDDVYDADPRELFLAIKRAKRGQFGKTVENFYPEVYEELIAANDWRI